MRSARFIRRELRLVLRNAGSALPAHRLAVAFAGVVCSLERLADLEEQAVVDGYGRVGAIIGVVLPLVVPGIIVVVIFTIPVALLFNAFLDRFIKGFTMGAVKG